MDRSIRVGFYGLITVDNLVVDLGWVPNVYLGLVRESIPRSVLLGIFFQKFRLQ